jgi:methylated-DNA-[protein]-cysteine S-methyltransferase
MQRRILRRIARCAFFVYSRGMEKKSNRSDLFSAIVEAPFGAIGIRTEVERVRELVYLPPSFDLKAPINPLAEQAALQVGRYLEEADFRFDLPLMPVGTAFQQQVWKVIAAIPRGDVLTYGEVAKLIRSAPRAVGQACGANWFPLIIPCHRVTSAGGLGGFSHQDDETGFHLGVKRWLLKHEGVNL